MTSEKVENGSVAIHNSGNSQQLQAIFEAVVERPSSITQFYQITPVIGIYDVEQIYIRCEQFFNTYGLIRSSVRVEVRTESGEFLRASSVHELRQFDEAQRSCTKSVDVEMTFLARIDSQTRPSSFKVEINFRDVPAMLKNTFLEVPDEVRSPIRLHVEFPDYIIARSIKLVVDDWIKTLKIVNASRIYKITESFAKMFNTLSAVSIGFAVSLGALLNFWSQQFNIEKFSSAASFFVFLYFSLRLTNRLIGGQLVRSVSKYAVASGFIITEGDRRKVEARNKRNERLQSISGFLSIAILLNLLVGICGNFIFNFLTKQ